MSNRMFCKTWMSTPRPQCCLQDCSFVLTNFCSCLPALPEQRKLLAKAKAESKAKAKASCKAKTKPDAAQKAKAAGSKAQEYLMKMDKRPGGSSGEPLIRYSLQRQPKGGEDGRKTRQVGQLPQEKKAFLENILASLRNGTLSEEQAKAAIAEEKKKG